MASAAPAENRFGVEREYMGWRIYRLGDGWGAEQIRAGGYRAIAEPQPTVELLCEVIRDTEYWFSI